MPNARQKILNFIIEQQSTTVEELSKVFRVTPANIRHHLSILVEQGSVKVVGYKHPLYKGRPTQIYSSSQQLDRNNLGNLSHALLLTLMTNRQSPNNRDIMVEISHQLAEKFEVGRLNPTLRLYVAIRALNQMNYQAHWEAHVDNPRIMLSHCPYLAILNDHPELCKMDCSLLELLLGAPVSLAERRVTNEKGFPECIFLIAKTSS